MTFGDEVPCDNDDASGAVMGPDFESSKGEDDEDDEEEDKSSHSGTQDSSDESSTTKSFPDKIEFKLLR